MYKSGWIEQGGVRSGTAGWYTVTWLKPFNTSNYTLTVGAVDGDTNFSLQVCGCINKTATSVKLANGHGGNAFPQEISFYACGY